LSDKHAEESSWKHGNSKDLNWLWYDSKNSNDYSNLITDCFSECNTILIDDLPGNSVNSSNRQNSITIGPFALFGEVKNRSEAYEDVSKDTSLLEVIDILEKVQTHLAGCYDDDRKETPVFSDENIEKIGLQSHIKSIQVKHKKTKQLIKTVSGIGVGHSPFFVTTSGGTRKQLRKTRKHRTHRKHRKQTRKYRK
jgi:hypothetical protein